MPAEPCAPLRLHDYGRFFPFPLISQLSIDWSLSVDATKSETLTGPARTVTTTLSGSGSGTIVIDCDTHRANLGGPDNVTADKFIVTRRLSADASHAEASKNFTLWCNKSPIGGSYSLDTRVETDYDDPGTTDTDTTTTDADDAVVIPIVLKIGLGQVSVEQFAIGSASQDLALALWLPPDDWTFDRADLFTAQTFTAAASASALGYDSGTGWEQSITITATPWVV